jgi:hypothetical protein
MPRVEQIVLPILRADFPAHVKVVSWTPDVDRRTYPIVKIRRMSGLPNQKRPDLLDFANIEVTAFSTATDTHYRGYSGTQDLILDAQHLLFLAVRNQTVIDGVGYLHSMFQTMGPIQLDSPFDDTWRWQSIIQLGLRPVRN